MLCWRVQRNDQCFEFEPNESRSLGSQKGVFLAGLAASICCYWFYTDGPCLFDVSEGLSEVVVGPNPGVNEVRMQNDALDYIYAPEGHEDGTSVESGSTDYGFPLSDFQDKNVFFCVLDNGNRPEEAICEWMRSRCSRRLAIADSADRGTVMFYHDCLVALANARRNLLTCDDQGRRDIFGYLRNLSRMSPRECSPTREMDMVQLDAAIVETWKSCQ